MKNGPPKQREITFRYEKRKDLSPPVTVHGSIGGTTQAGMVVAHLYSEYVALPKGERLTIDQAGGVSKKVLGRDETVIREIHSCLLMPPEVAVSVGKWLVGHGEKSLSVRNEIREGGSNDATP